MTTALTVLSAGREPMEAPFALDDRAQRPGTAHEIVELDLAPTPTVIVRELASLDGLPVGLWAAIAVESERARVATGADIAALDAAASRTGPRAPFPTRLTAYAAALRAASSRPAERARIAMPVAYHTVLAWSLAAEGSMLAWICAQLEAVPRRRHLWEAAAAERGQTLGEWVALAATQTAASTSRSPEWRPGA